MRTVNKSSAGRRAAALALLLALAAGILPAGDTRAQQNPGAADSPRHAGAKVSPDLREQMQAARSQDETARVILQLKAPAGSQLQAMLGGGRAQVKGHFARLDSYSLDVPFEAVEQLADFEEVESVSHDREMYATGHVTTTTGAANVRTLPALKGTGSVAVDGTGVGIAVLDSGIYGEHLALKDASGGSRIVYAKDFTGEGITADPYGHGTHVASTAAGNDKLSGQSGTFAGIAPNATLISLRVLDSRGVGKVSSVLAALDWVLANGSRYKVKVVNLSLGAPAVDSYTIDPLCRAVRRMVDAGVVVVA
ncbi:MAG TPA: S8 family serine peptidase, partial [Pyrinomonadaceae bacterium]|nr:S8 family serine peptidase [Pyrinomonadaceae bacterium]